MRELAFLNKGLNITLFDKTGKKEKKYENKYDGGIQEFVDFIDKQLLTKSDIKKLKFSPKNTANTLSQKSFVQKFLQSVKSKMYSNRKK